MTPNEWIARRIVWGLRGQQERSKMTRTWRRILVDCGLGLRQVGLGFLAGVGAADVATVVVAGERA